jgi:predicted transposase YbfD/YdcC
VCGLSAEAFADAVRSHWSIENNLHWILDVTFNGDQSRLRAGRGAKNVAVVRHFALNSARQAAGKRPSKDAAKAPLKDPKYLLEILQETRC